MSYELRSKRKLVFESDVESDRETMATDEVNTELIKQLRDQLQAANEAIESLKLDFKAQSSSGSGATVQHPAPLLPNSQPSQHSLQRANLPKFNPEYPQLWLTQVELAFKLGGVVNDDERYANLLVCLEGDALRAVEDLANNPPSANKFVTLKERLIHHFAPSPESQLRRMLRGEDMTGRKPSDILAHMRHLAGGRCDTSIMRTLFFDRLPENMRSVLLATGQEDLDKLVEVADKIFDMSNAQLCPVSTTLQPTQDIQVINRQADSTLDDIRKSIQFLRQEIHQLKMESPRNQRSTSRRRSTSRTRSKSRSRLTQTNKNGLCYYHQKFGDEARNCRAGCPKHSEN